jgi:hypothetical protein
MSGAPPNELLHTSGTLLMRRGYYPSWCDPGLSSGVLEKNTSFLDAEMTPESLGLPGHRRRELPIIVWAGSCST